VNFFKANLERKCYTDGHENDVFWYYNGFSVKAFLWLKRLWCIKNPTFYVLEFA